MWVNYHEIIVNIVVFLQLPQWLRYRLYDGALLYIIDTAVCHVKERYACVYRGCHIGSALRRI